MEARLRGRLEVATCIACGARSRAGDCPDGCTDVPLDLVDAVEVDLLAERLRALESRASVLREVVASLAAGGDWEQLRGRALAAMKAADPPPLRDPEIVQAWGCPECGRVDAPQPCLDVCIRRPVPMVDASEYRSLAVVAAAVERRERRLQDLVRLVAHVNPRAELAERHQTGLRARAAALLEELG